jgi:hypothetical protein
MKNPKPPTSTIPLEHPAETRARIATAWAELVEAAKTDPKARAFLAAFGPADTAGLGATPNAASPGKDDPPRGSDGARRHANDSVHTGDAGHGRHDGSHGGAGQDSFEASHAPDGSDRG